MIFERPRILDRFRCCKCGRQWEQRPEPSWNEGRFLGFTRAAEDCPACGCRYAEKIGERSLNA